MIKKPWLKKEEKKFQTLLKLEKKFPDFQKISLSLKKSKINKTPKQCYTKWYNNKSKKAYKIIFPEPKNKFSIKEEKKLLKLSFSLAPNWKKISDHFISKNRFDVCNHFYGIVRKGLGKACKLIGKKNSTKILWKIKPKLYASLISRDVKIDLRAFKNFDFGKKYKDCPDFKFIYFWEFIWKFYFNDFQEVWEKVNEIEIFITKKVIVYIIDINFKYNTEVNMTKKKKLFYLKNEKFLLNHKNEINNSLTMSFYEKNFSIIKLISFKENEKVQEIKKIQNSSENLKNNQIQKLNFQHKKNKKRLREIFVYDEPLFFLKSKNVEILKSLRKIYNKKIKVFFKFHKKSYVNQNTLKIVRPRIKNFEICKNYSKLVISSKTMEFEEEEIY